MAVIALGNSGSKKAVGPLIGLLDYRERATVRKHAAEALGKIGDKEAVDHLIAAINDLEPDVREYSIEALGKIGDSRAVEPLIAALKDYRWEMRKNAREALEKIGDERSVEPLRAAKEFEINLSKAPSIDRGGESRRCSFCGGGGKKTRESGAVRFAGGKHRLYVEETCSNCNGTGFSRVR